MNLNTFNILRQETVISIVSLCLVLVLLTSLTVVFTWKRWKRRLLLARSAQVSRSGRSSQIRRLFFFSLFTRGGWKLPLLTFAKVKDAADQLLTPQQWILLFCRAANWFTCWCIFQKICLFKIFKMSANWIKLSSQHRNKKKSEKLLGTAGDAWCTRAALLARTWSMSCTWRRRSR